jgi:hypothetical protein
MPTVPSTTTLRESYQRHYSAIEAVQTPLSRPRVNRHRLLELTHILLQNFQPLLATLEQELSTKSAALRRQQFNRLEELAQAVYLAELNTLEEWPDDAKLEFERLVESVQGHDTYLLGWATPLFLDDETIQKELDSIRRGRGHQDDVEDVLRLVALWRKQWAKVKGKTPVTEARLLTAEQEATRLSSLLTSTEMGKNQREKRELRRKAYTLWEQHYTLLRDTALYLERGTSELKERFPTIHNPSKRKPSDPAAPSPNP